MKYILAILLLLILPSLGLMAQNADEDDDLKPWKTTGWQFGIMPGFELAATPLNNPLVFSPDLVASYKNNVFGIGPRLPSFSGNEHPSVVQYYGFGVNFLHYLRPTHKTFDWFVYYDFEYYYLKTQDRYYWMIYPGGQLATVNPQSRFYNFTLGYGYHLNFTKHIYMSQMLAFGISIQKETSFYSNNGQVLCAMLKVGMGYNF